MKQTVAVLAVAVLLGTAGCAGNGGVTKQGVGTVVGGALGGLVGSQVGSGTGQLAATAAGAIAGAFIGSSIGKSMDEQDKMKAAQALETARTGHTVAWQNPDSGAHYAVTPTRTYEQSGQPCREYTTEAWIDGKRETLKGTACRQPDGTWRAT